MLPMPLVSRTRALRNSVLAITAFATVQVALPVARAQAEAQGKRPLAPADIFALEYAGEPQISPDGQWVAYVRRWSDISTDRRHSNLWLVRADGSQHRPLTGGAFTEQSPRWSPDGTRLLYISNRSGTPQLHVRYMDTGESFQITQLPNAPSAPVWSADGTQVAFLSLLSAPPLVVGQPLAPPSGATWAAPPKYTDKLAFRWDGVGEVPTGYMHAFVVAATGGAARQVTSGDFHHGAFAYGSGTVAWTPDGRELVLPAYRGPNPEWNARDSELYAVDVVTGALRQLTKRFGPDASPVVSPDGKLIAYTGYDDRKVGYQNTLLYVMNRDGSGARALSTKLDQSVASPVWSADGRALYVQVDIEGNTKVARISLDGSYSIVASHLGNGTSAYSGGAYSVSRTGTVTFTLSTPTIVSDVAIATGASTYRALTSLNASLMAQREIGAVEEIWYESSKDKRRIHGWIIKPPRFDASKKYPLILEIHGGPFANYGDRFDEEKQLMAADGYVVLYTNPRGSTSYGEEFGNLIHHAYPGDDLYDLESGVDAVIAKGYIDAQNLFITGGSGGGVLTAWVIGHTTRYKAALAFYPVINWESFSLTADMSSASVNNWFPGFPWDHPENYAKRSLLSVVKNVKTPTLVMTGEEDFRTPMSESEQYYKALKMLGVESVLVRVPEEPHGIRRRPSHEASKITTLTGWFEKYKNTPRMVQ